MAESKVYRAIGLMSGTSLDGVDAAIIETDGHAHVKPLGFHSFAYAPEERAQIRACLGNRDGGDPQLRAAAEMLTRVHARAVKELLGKTKTGPQAVDVIGFHGQTVAHDPGALFTLQIGDADLLAAETGIDVVADFRAADVKAGGQGAPLLPLYHRARTQNLPRPLAIVNIGGVANITWIGAGEDEILAFDTGPGNALIDDFVFKRTGQTFDADGALAAKGHAAAYLLDRWFASPYFNKKPPKSLDRDAWSIAGVETLSDADGAATLTVFTAEAILTGLNHLPQAPAAWYVTGGGRRNGALMRYLRTHLQSFRTGTPVEPVEALGWDGDAIEAEGFAYLAVRSLLREPVTLPGTTGVAAPLSGGRLHRASPRAA